MHYKIVEHVDYFDGSLKQVRYELWSQLLLSRRYSKEATRLLPPPHFASCCHPWTNCILVHMTLLQIMETWQRTASYAQLKMIPAVRKKQNIINFFGVIQFQQGFACVQCHYMNIYVHWRFSGDDLRYAFANNTKNIASSFIQLPNTKLTYKT